MALEKQPNSGMPLKQKLMMVAVVIIFLVVIWQVVGLMGGGSGSTPPPTVVKPVANANQNAKGAVTPQPAAHAMNATPPAATTNQAPGQPGTQQVELKQMPVANDSGFMQQQQANEQKYIGKINDLEDLKLQRAIAETNQAIATAKLATVTAEKNISDLLTKPAMPEVPAGTYANKLANPGAPGENPGTPPVGVIVQSIDYSVISVSMQLGRWSAVVGTQGKLYNVVVGDVLTPDGSVVVRINKNGVVLRKNGQIRKIGLTASL